MRKYIIKENKVNKEIKIIKVNKVNELNKANKVNKVLQIKIVGCIFFLASDNMTVEDLERWNLVADRTQVHKTSKSSQEYVSDRKFVLLIFNSLFPRKDRKKYSLTGTMQKKIKTTSERTVSRDFFKFN